jgi:tetratricopeptide (TPR) repeat protein
MALIHNLDASARFWPARAMRFGSFMLLFVVATARVASADDAEAKRHYERGMKSYNLQEFDVALREFKGAYVEHPDAAFLYNIAQCQRQLGQYEAAAKSYRAFLQQNPNVANADEVRHLAEQMDAAASQQRTVQNAPPTSIAPPSTQPSAVPTVATEERHREPAVDQLGRARLERRAGLGLGIGGVVLCGLGGAFAGLASSAGNTAYGPIYDYNADQRFHAYRNAEIAMFVVGGAAVATGVTLLILGQKVPR